jgi:hypothetical protein
MIQRSFGRHRNHGRSASRLLSIAAFLVPLAVLPAAPSHAVTLDWVAEGWVNSFPGGYVIRCLALSTKTADSTFVVTQTSITDCYLPGPGSVAALPITTPGWVAETGIATAAARTTNVVCARALFAYLDTPLGGIPTAGVHDTGLVCSDRNAERPV